MFVSSNSQNNNFSELISELNSLLKYEQELKSPDKIKVIHTFQQAMVLNRSQSVAATVAAIFGLNAPDAAPIKFDQENQIQIMEVAARLVNLWSKTSADQPDVYAAAEKCISRLSTFEAPKPKEMHPDAQPTMPLKAIWLAGKNVRESGIFAGPIKQGCRLAFSPLQDLKSRNLFLIRARATPSTRNPDDWIKYDCIYLSTKSLSKRLFLTEKQIYATNFLEALSDQINKVRTACKLYEASSATMRPEDRKAYGELVFKVALCSEGLFTNLTVLGKLRSGALVPGVCFAKVKKGKIHIFAEKCPDQLGSGAFGNVFKIREVIENIPYALKVSNPEALNGIKYGRELLTEANNLNKLPSHAAFQPAPVLVYDNRVKSEKGVEGNVFMISKLFEYPGLQSPDLFAWLHQPQKPSDKFAAFEQLWFQWLTLFDDGIYHGDISPTNILVEPGRFSLADFATAQMELNELDYPSARKYKFLPEDHEIGLRSKDLGTRIRTAFCHDIFSMGTSFFQMLTQQYPYDFGRSEKLDEAAGKERPAGKLKMQLLEKYSKDCQELLKEMLSFEIPKTDLGLVEKVARMKVLALKILQRKSLFNN